MQRRVIIIITGKKILKLKFQQGLLSRERSKWPAIILAASRIDKVNGRIILLENSITTIKGNKIGGVPKGIRRERASFGS